VELLNAIIVFPVFVLAVSLNVKIGPLTVCATVLLCFFLIVGSAFSFLKCRNLQNGMQTLNKYANIFRVLRRSAPILLCAVFLILIFQWQEFTLADRGLGLMMFVLAILEYINCFYIQLMYDTRGEIAFLLVRRRLKRGLIAREFGW